MLKHSPSLLQMFHIYIYLASLIFLMYAHIAVIYRKRKANKDIEEEKPTCKIHPVAPDGPPRAEVAPQAQAQTAPLMRTHPVPRDWPTRERPGNPRLRDPVRPHSTSSFCICPPDFTSRGMCVCGRGREFASTNRASAMSFSSYREPPTRDRDSEPERPSSPRSSEAPAEVEPEATESESTEMNVTVEGENGEASETDTLQSKRGLRRKHRAFFFTNDGINVFLRAGMIGTSTLRCHVRAVALLFRSQSRKKRKKEPFVFLWQRLFFAQTWPIIRLLLVLT